jgi:type II secretory pathway pseudopilin PulG
MKKGFSLTDVLLTLVIVSVVFVLSVPVLYENADEKNLVSELYEFNSGLENAVNQWKAELNCPYSVKVCLGLQKTLLNESADFDKISTHMNIIEQQNEGPSDLYWLPLRTLNYSGTDISEYGYRSVLNRRRYLLPDGKIFSVETDDDGFWLLVDVNGKRLPNRIGKDTFHVIVGYNTSGDISYNAREKTKDKICGPNYSHIEVKCDPENVDPTIGNGASPGTYALLHHSLPDYKVLSEKVAGFRP